MVMYSANSNFTTTALQIRCELSSRDILADIPRMALPSQLNPFTIAMDCFSSSTHNKSFSGIVSGMHSQSCCRYKQKSPITLSSISRVHRCCSKRLRTTSRIHFTLRLLRTMLALLLELVPLWFYPKIIINIADGLWFPRPFEWSPCQLRVSWVGQRRQCWIQRGRRFYENNHIAVHGRSCWLLWRSGGWARYFPASARTAAACCSYHHIWNWKSFSMDQSSRNHNW